MTESFAHEPTLNFRDRWIKPFSTEVNPTEVALLRKTAKQMGIDIGQQLQGTQGGGILSSSEDASEKVKHESTENPRAKALIMGKTHGSTEFNTAVHFPTNKEHQEFGANLFAYQSQLGEYLRHHWNPESFGLNPLQGVLGGVKLEDGRYVTAIRYRKNFEMLGRPGKTGVHEMDTSHLTMKDTRKLVQVLNETHVDSKAFIDWNKQSGRDIPAESWLNPSNKNYALRGKEWWVSPNGENDRIHELSEHVTKQSELFRTIDPSFDAATSIQNMITNNLELFPHQNGTIDHPDLVGDTVLVHGALHPQNVHIRHDGEQTHVTLSGGDRAQGMGLKGQMIDWLVTSAVNSPDHQKAMLDEFIRLNPSDKDRRGLAMHVLYRSVLETSWFTTQGKMQEANTLAKLSYDILKGNDIWKGVNTPLSPSK